MVYVECSKCGYKVFEERRVYEAGKYALVHRCVRCGEHNKYVSTDIKYIVRKGTYMLGRASDA